ncbi:MAG: DNA mismatch repair protein MutS, partial [Pseudobdellovibrionaceae bacterium]
MIKETPLMKQYNEIKAHHLDKILFFRMGDFYEMFGSDAEKAAPVLGIALTQRNKKSEGSPSMCGMPHHSASGAINKLLSVGLKVAICEQVEDPATAKGIVKRAVTQVLTPGVVYDYTTLNQSTSHYLACYENQILAFLDASTGESFVLEIPSLDRAIETLNYYPVAEFVTYKTNSVLDQSLLKIPLSTVQHKVELSVLKDLTNIEEKSLQIPALQTLLSYLAALSGNGSLRVIRQPIQKNLESSWNLTPRLQKQLEIFQNNVGHDEPTVFSCLDRTETSAGRRKLRSWLMNPLRDLSEILFRQKKIQFWKNDFPKLKQLRKVLSGVGDIERRYVRLTSAQANARDLAALADAVLSSIEALNFADDQIILGNEMGPGDFLKSESFEKLKLQALTIKSTLLDELPLQIKHGYLIKTGISENLDELISLSQNAQAYLEKYETEQKEFSGISSLKVRYNQVFGYYIEITNSQLTKVPAVYKRKQTLANAERFYTDELMELEKKILSSQTKRFELEHQMFLDLKEQILNFSPVVAELSLRVSELDIYSSMAWLSLERSYCTPKFLNEQRIQIKGLKHFVLDQIKTEVVPSDLIMEPQQVLLITGPNMAGKSTVMRQLAVTVILAQCGFDVPAVGCELPLFDQIFTRIGANDALSQGLSTFMVEMTETA